VLVVDDDTDFREAVRLLLEAKGMGVLEAGDGAAAIAILDDAGARGEPVELVLLDYWMPGMAAAECARALRERLGEGAEIILVTAAAKPAERAAELGIKRYLSKPFGLDQLERIVARDEDVR
jgi:CheY-like chemotaxis protein